ncbi:hypothetical protein TRAPUB_7953 [Trametes pubescens]|uniref:Uncharacterized protein n=1 Tax=Trametes pubescens TaxID=154538 RepID=A0A1M2V200_TRAPU|nr:hypothetical protein TRAPUB_7953 [Trametes pubescens]
MERDAQTQPDAAGNAAGSQSIPWTPEDYLAAFEAANDQYWREHGLSMMHSSHTTSVSVPAAQGTAAPGAPSTSAAQPHTQAVQDRAYYELLPQQEYVAKRRFQPKPPVLFRTWSTPYVKLADALTGNVALLLGRDEAVLPEDHLSQKQSLRLEIVGCRSYERQINVRNPANGFRSITKGKLAEKIAREIHDYMNRHQSAPFGLPRLGLGPGTAGFERLVLLELRHVSKSSWQPVLGVLRAE